MDTATAAGRDFWREVLLAGGATTVPRWTLDPAPGVGEHDTTVPPELVEAVRQRAVELALPLRSVLLTAHAKVLAALSGSDRVVTGYVAIEGGHPLPCRLDTRPGTWRALLHETHRVESRLLRHWHLPISEIRRELDVPGPAFETVFAPAGMPGAPTEDVVLTAGFAPDADRLTFCLRYRTEALDAGAAARIAGYHLAALALIAADPDAEHGRRCLLSPEEVDLQLRGFAGPRRELPDRRVHELFEERVRRHPDAVAVEHGDRRWSYRELDARANQVARALLARGLRREEIVAVVTERTPDWVTAVLAVLKAGGAYLPVEPRFPAARVATMLARAGCRLVVAESADVPALAAAPGIRTLTVDAACGEGHPTEDLGLEVTPDQLAYVFFTSGSTGEPKGAMCEHAGLLNHLFAKIDDLDIGEGDVVAQTAPQCFDISLWQVLAPLLAGGRTHLVAQEVVLDVPRFLDTVVAARVGVLQLVPSYLEAVLSALEHAPRALPDLRYVSVTGEALPKELVQRWLAAVPGVPLVNAYGLTETSDDTNHAVIDRVPGPDGIPLGPPINNVRVYVVDDQLAPVPLGAPGEIVFSGVCVGRGYVGDPERTARSFVPDPHRPGERLYRSGDLGRWRPGGSLEFLGRRDTQVKIRGFRIEIGEVENALVGVPGVRQGAVVAAEGPDGGRYLVAFCTGERPLGTDLLRAELARSLPEYMVPAALHWRDRLPLTANGKVDRAALAALATELGPTGEDHDAPATPTEERLAAAWATVLGLPREQVGRRDHFFDRGGTSLSALKLAVRLGREVSLEDLGRHPVLSDLARLLDSRSSAVAPAAADVLVPR